MNKGGPGAGSASILLVFTVLCLMIFAFITYEAAWSDKVMTDTWAQAVTEYYAADALAEDILAEILAADEIPKMVLDVEISVELDDEKDTEIASFSFPMSSKKMLNVRVAIYKDRFEILEWKTKDAGFWELDDSMSVWPGL